MFDFIKRWKEKARKERRRRGYQHAAERLLKEGKEAVEDLLMSVDTMRVFGDYDEFDIGVEDAIRDYKRLNNAEIIR